MLPFVTIVGSVTDSTGWFRGVGGVEDGASEDCGVDFAATLCVGVIIGNVWSGIEGVPWREAGREAGYMPGMYSSGPKEAMDGDERSRVP